MKLKENNQKQIKIKKGPDGVYEACGFQCINGKGIGIGF